MICAWRHHVVTNGQRTTAMCLRRHSNADENSPISRRFSCTARKGSKCDNAGRMEHSSTGASVNADDCSSHSLMPATQILTRARTENGPCVHFIARPPSTPAPAIPWLTRLREDKALLRMCLLCMASRTATTRGRCRGWLAKQMAVWPSPSLA
jgi:hypothetical protein